MDFFEWVGSSISDGVDWLFTKDGLDAATDATKIFSGGGKDKGTSVSRTSGIMARQQPQYGSSGTSGRSDAEPTKAAKVYGMESKLYSNRADNDPWMGMFRRMLNQSEQ